MDKCGETVTNLSNAKFEIIPDVNVEGLGRILHDLQACLQRKSID